MEEGNIAQWKGTLVIKDGLYANSILNFKILIPDDYPNNSPTVFFEGKVYHPLIDQANGKLDVIKLFPKWQPGKNFLLQLIIIIKDLFYDPKYFQISDSFNPEGGRLFAENFDQFEEKVTDTTKSTIDGNILDRSRFDNDDIAKDIIKIIEVGGTSQEKQQKIKEWFFRELIPKAKEDKKE